MTMLRPLSLALALGLLTLSACEPAEPRKPNAVGERGEIAVVMDSATFEGPAGDALRATVGRSVAPPLNISDFRLRRTELTDARFRSLRGARAVLFGAVLDGDTSAVARFIEARLDSAGVQMIRAGEGTVVVPRRDVWARGQLVVFAAAASDTALATAFTNAADTLRTILNEITLSSTEEDMFSRGRQPDLEQAIAQDHDFAVNVQHDYFLSQDTSTTEAGHPGRYIRIRRVLSDTWRDFSVYYQESAAPLDSAAIEQITDDVLRTYVLGQYDSTYVKLDRNRPILNESVTLGGYETLQSRGLWRMHNDLMGGPFVRYSFYEPDQQRHYIMYGMVFAPQHRFRGNKREYLRQLEVIARTFRTGTENPPGTEP